ncbi:hypothetical protein F511_19784 [Dorcoceras hygrometricum]|uniref:Uncharacterized protein n=1 Tax=Dorcoceras hygrometricum TaxID=472368 RepID=A0A2Z7AJA9_9LAMI|nr:hypothetical protein F511_19784 [Dorcoceras hygrometricum]
MHSYRIYSDSRFTNGVDLIGIYGLKGPYCTLTMTNWFWQALSVIPRGSWGDVSRRFTMIRWAQKLKISKSIKTGPGIVYRPEHFTGCPGQARTKTLEEIRPAVTTAPETRWSGGRPAAATTKFACGSRATLRQARRTAARNVAPRRPAVFARERHIQQHHRATAIRPPSRGAAIIERPPRAEEAPDVQPRCATSARRPAIARQAPDVQPTSDKRPKSSHRLCSRSTTSREAAPSVARRHATKRGQRAGSCARRAMRRAHMRAAIRKPLALIPLLGIRIRPPARQRKNIEYKPGDDQYEKFNDNYHCGRYRQSGPRPETRLLRQPALEGLTRSARTDSPRRIGRKRISGEDGRRRGGYVSDERILLVELAGNEFPAKTGGGGGGYVSEEGAAKARFRVSRLYQVFC